MSSLKNHFELSFKYLIFLKDFISKQWKKLIHITVTQKCISKKML